MKRSSRAISLVSHVLVGLAAVVTLAAGFVTFENWRGDRAWAATRAEFASRGDPIVSPFLPRRSIPAELNLFRTPLLLDLIQRNPANQPGKSILLQRRLSSLSYEKFYQDDALDFTAFREELIKRGFLDKASSGDEPASALLAAMDQINPLLDEIRQAAQQRPEAVMDFPLGEVEGSLDVGIFFNVVRELALRAICEVAVGRTDDAFADTIALLRLGHGLADNPSNLLHLLIGEAIRSYAIKPVLAGRRRHLWSDVQLADLQQRLLQFEALAGYASSLRIERNYAVTLVDQPRVAGSSQGLKLPHWLFHGWIQQNKVYHSHAIEELFAPAFSIKPARIFPDKLRQMKESMKALQASRAPYHWLARVTLAHIQGLLPGMGREADQIRQAAIACALERYYLAHGSYPPALEPLVPRFLAAIPDGLFDGQPLRYGRLPSGEIQVYFLGLNERDDGGANSDPAKDKENDDIATVLHGTK